MTQNEQVIEALKKNGGYATLGQLYHLVDFSTWGTKTEKSTKTAKQPVIRNRI